MFENYDKEFGGYRVSQSALSIKARVELKLDEYVKTAMEWPNPEGGIWDSNETAKLRNELAKAKASAAGRGLAEALFILCEPQYASPDAVIRAAVERYQNPVPETSVNGQTPEEAAAVAAPRKAAPVEALDAEKRTRIKAALDANFDADALAKMFKVSVAEIEACR